MMQIKQKNCIKERHKYTVHVQVHHHHQVCTCSVCAAEDKQLVSVMAAWIGEMNSFNLLVP